MRFVYSGEAPGLEPTAFQESVETLLDVMALADLYVIDALKYKCESALSKAVRSDTVDLFVQVAKAHNAPQLRDVCLHFHRNTD